MIRPARADRAPRRGGHGGSFFLGDLFLNVAVIVIFVIAAAAVDMRPASEPRPDASGAAFLVCRGTVAMQDGSRIAANALSGSDFGRAGLAADPTGVPLIRIGEGGDTSAFLLATHLARLGRTRVVFAEGRCPADLAEARS